jgi:hypothetical protein
MLVRIVAPHFVAGLIVDDAGRVSRADPAAVYRSRLSRAVADVRA